ncbi:MAG: hypothetical protein GF411_12185 [Candidatus Lokiarchaeota archaeon]|nr:hypothetical protein [Candidatus Lokiarchaeota archaeon]
MICKSPRGSHHMKRIGIVGNGIAAITAIREIRKIGNDIAIDVFTDEKYPYYPRPKLIDIVSGSISESDIIQFDLKWYNENNVNLHLSEPVTEIIPDSKTILTASDTYFNYHKILLANGSHPFVPPIHGVEKKRVHVLRTLDDAISVRADVKGAGREIIVGGGILGIELAAAMKELGGSPIVISNIHQLLPAQLDAGASDFLIHRLEDMGISIYLGFMCREISGADQATGVVSTTGDKIKGDNVVIATGVRPNTSLASESGIKVNLGVIVDQYMQTSVRDIYAAGDCTEWNGVCWGIIPVALETARCAAKNIVDHGSAHYAGTTPSNTLKVAGIELTSIGLFNVRSPEYRSIVSANDDSGTYFKAVLKDDVFVGGIALGDRKVAMNMRRAIANKTIISDPNRELFEQ